MKNVPILILFALGILCLLCGCRSSKNVEQQVERDYSGDWLRLSRQMDSLRSDFQVSRRQVTDKLSNLKLEHVTTYYTPPDSTGKQYPVYVSTTKADKDEHTTEQSDTDLNASIRRLELRMDSLFSVINAAMNQAFFTLSVGIGAMCIFGSYQGKDRSLTGEAMWIMGLDTFVALMAGLIIFPACFAFGVEPGSGPGLVFVTLPNIFNVMAGGQLWGTLFFIFMSFAALSTVIAVFENIISYSADVWGMERRRATWVHAVGIWVCSLPCALGFNLLADFQPLGPGTCVLDLEDFLISNNILPLGGLFFLLFCCLRRGWGWDNFIAEVDQGIGMKFPRWLRGYVTYVLPCLIIFVFVMGYVDKFWK